MSRFLILLIFILPLGHGPYLNGHLLTRHKSIQTPDYFQYHEEILAAEKLITLEKYDEALAIYDRIFSEYRFVFLKDYKIATQLAVHSGKDLKAFEYLKKSIRAGWDLKAIKKNNFLKGLRGRPEWKDIETAYPQLRAQYESGLDQELRSRVKKMYSQDQKKAMGALLKLSSKGQDKYAENKFAPHSEAQMEELKEILDSHGYPGERLIGNDYWMSTILSHHNSISEDYNKKDTVYPGLKSKLMQALAQGQVSPFELALIDDWYRTVSKPDQNATYGILNPPSKAKLTESNALRRSVGLRDVELRNSLVDMQEKTGMDFYLPGNAWIDGKIEIK